MVTLTPKAAEELKRMISQRGQPNPTIVRLGVVGGGCSGFEYRLEFAETPDEAQDVLTESRGVRLAVDRRSQRVLEGTEIDYHEDLLKRGFVFHNPLAVRTCGCGTSFGVA